MPNTADDLSIPAFLDKRNKENNVTTHTAPVETPPEPQPEITLDMIMEQIKKLSAKRDEIQVTLSGLKKQAQKIIGSL